MHGGKQASDTRTAYAEVGTQAVIMPESLAEIQYVIDQHHSPFFGYDYALLYSSCQQQRPQAEIVSCTVYGVVQLMIICYLSTESNMQVIATERGCYEMPQMA